MTCQVVVDIKMDTVCGAPSEHVGPVPMCAAHMVRWLAHEPTLLVFDNTPPRPDIEPIGESYDNACMLPWRHYDDGRWCHYHARLDAWVTRGPDGPLDQRCLREHPPVEELMRRKPDGQ